MATFGGAYGGGGAVIAAPVGRGDFVEALVSGFELRRIGVDRAVVGYVLDEVLAPEEDWQQGIEDGRVDLEHVSRLITESLDEAADVAERRTRLVIDEPIARAAFWKVIHERRNCAFPFMIC